MVLNFLAGTAETQEAVASEKKKGDSFWASTMAEALDAVSSEKKEGDVAPVSTADNKDDGGAATYKVDVLYMRRLTLICPKISSELT